MKNKGMIRDCPMDVCTKNLWQKAEIGKKTSIKSTTRVLQTSYFEIAVQCVPETWGRMYNTLPQSAQGMRKWDKELDSRAAKKGVKKLVSSNFVKNLE